MLECKIFIHQETGLGVERDRIDVRAGLLRQQDEPNKWKISWGKKSFLLTDQDVHMLSIGGTVSTAEHGRLSISMSPADGGTLAQIVGDLFMKQVA